MRLLSSYPTQSGKRRLLERKPDRVRIGHTNANKAPKMSASSAALNDEATTANVSLPTPGTSSYANIVQKDNHGDKDKDKAHARLVNDASAKKSSTATANTTNTTTKTDKAKETTAQATTVATADSSQSSGSTNDNVDDVIDPEDDASFTPVVSHSRKDRNSRRNKVSATLHISADNQSH